MERRRKRPDPVSLVAGIAMIVFGTALALDQGSSVDISAGLLAALFVGLFGLIMLISGLLDE